MLFHSYQPITVLPSVSKIFERLMQNLMLPFVQSFLSPLLCGFREGYGTQHALLYLIEACNKSIDSGGIAGAVLTDLSKAFDCLDHELLIAKLNAYGFTRSALLFVHGYLDSRKQGNDLQLPKVHTATYGIETISFLENRLRSTLPNIINKQAHFIF